MEKRIGSQKPTKKLFLPYQETIADEAIESYEKSGRKAYDWQKNLVNPMMALNDEGLWTHLKFGFSIPRQNGKNEVVAIREFEGLKRSERILHTAHRTTTSAAAFNRLLGIMESSGLEEKTDFNKIKATGRESIELIGGGRIDFRTRTSSGGLGESFDLLVIDEAQEYTTDQESALMYTIAASQNPQTVYCGTPPTPISSGTIFNDLRNMVFEGDSIDTGWAEWSVEEQSEMRDVELWYKTNPSLGLRLSERNIQSEVRGDEIDFNIQRLGLWIKYNLKSAISREEWDRLQVPALPKLKGKLFAGIKYGYDGTNVALSIAVKTENDKVFVEAIDCRSIRNGNKWIIDFLLKADVQEVVIDGASGQNILAEDMKKAKLKKPLLPTVKEYIVASSTFEQSLFQENILHAGQPSLSEVVTNSEKRTIGTQGGFGYKSQLDDFDIALMESVILANWSCVTAKEIKKQKIQY